MKFGRIYVWSGVSSVSGACDGVVMSAVGSVHDRELGLGADSGTWT